MEHKVGDRFIIEIDSSYVSEVGKTPGVLYKMKGFNSLVFDEAGLSKLQKIEAVGVQETEFSVGDIVLIDERYYGELRKAIIIEVDSNCVTIFRDDGMTDVIYAHDYAFIRKTGRWTSIVSNLLTALKEGS